MIQPLFHTLLRLTQIIRLKHSLRLSKIQIIAQLTNISITYNQITL